MSGYIANTMKRTRKKIVSVIFAVAMMTVPMMFASTTAAAEGLNNEEIESSLINYSEPGYQYLEKLGVGMWKVLYARPDWRYGWEVVITTTSSNPENSILVIGTSLLATDHVNMELLTKLLDENSYDNNPGNYSVFFENNVYYVQYSLKMPQMLMNKKALLEAIGFVAGYTNSKVKSIEQILYGNDSSKQNTYSKSSAQAARKSASPAPAPAPVPTPEKEPESVKKPAPSPQQTPAPAPAATPEPKKEVQKTTPIPEPVVQNSAPDKTPEVAEKKAPTQVAPPDTAGKKTVMAKCYLEADGTISIDNTDLESGKLYTVLNGDKPILEVMVTKVGFLSSKAKITSMFVKELDSSKYLVGDRVVY